MYKVTFLPTAEESFKKLDPSTQRRIAQKIDWLSQNADKVIHHPLTNQSIIVWTLKTKFPRPFVLSLSKHEWRLTLRQAQGERGQPHRILLRPVGLLEEYV